MEVGNQIKKYRAALGINQEDLADRIYVSRQTVSNWENGKSYPDVNSLLRLSEVFGISVDTLIKGDIAVMREKIKEEDVKRISTLGKIYAVMLLVLGVSAVPLFSLGVIGKVVWVLVFAATMFVAVMAEKEKKEERPENLLTDCGFYGRKASG